MNSIFDIIGPVMIGPSSSHTAGAARLGKMARCIFRSTPKRVALTLYGSFAKTYKGHGTDKALLGGLLGFKEDDTNIRIADTMAQQEGMEYKFIESPLDVGASECGAI
nr:serine dehydratase beta chain [Veillonella denticariosi]